MKVSTKPNKPWGVILLMLALCVPAAWAQQKDPRVNPPVAPLPPITQGESSSVPAGNLPAPAAAARQDKSPLTSAQVWSPGNSSAGRNFLLPSLSIYSGGDSNPTGLQSNGSVSAVTTFGGQLALQHVWGRNEFVTEYAGSGTFYARFNGSSGPDRSRSYQDLRFSYKTIGRRWTFLLADSVGYSPEGGSGGGLGFGQLGTGPGSISGNPLVNLNTQLSPNQSIVSANARRLSNTVVGEYQLSAGRRSAVTFGGSYGILRFIDDGYIDSDTIGFRAGYNYSPTARDTLALSYGGSLSRFLGMGRENISHMVQLSYGRRVTGRMSLHVAAGPQITALDTALGTRESLVSWSLDSFMRYHFNQADTTLAYRHGVSGGSGVFLGSEIDEVSASLSRQLSRLWRGSVDFAFAHNDSLQEIALGAAGRRFNTWRGGFELSRPVGRYARMYFRYGVERQSAANVVCGGAGCPLFGTRQIFGLGFNFRFKTIELE
jgi:hypothetical protein